MRRLLRTIYILWGVFRFGLDQLALPGINHPGLHLLSRVVGGQRLNQQCQHHYDSQRPATSHATLLSIGDVGSISPRQFEGDGKADADATRRMRSYCPSATRGFASLIFSM